MKGTVVNIWLNTITTLYGEKTKDAILTKEGWDPRRMITPLEEIEDKKILSLMSAFAQNQGIKTEEMWKKLGQNNIASFYKWFPSFFDKSTAMGFLMLMDKVHTQLTKMIPGAKPPRLIPEPLDDKNFVMTYKSKRGLDAYLMGLIEGVGAHFNEKIEAKILDKKVESDGTHIVRIHLAFEKSPKHIKTYKLSKLFSFGFIKQTSLKILLIPTLLSALFILIMNGTDNLPLLIGTPLVTLVSGLLIGKIVNAPTKGLQEELEKIQKLELSQDLLVRTGDAVEETYGALTRAKESLREELTYMKGGMDDLYSFTGKFSKVAQNMSEVSDLISRSVQEVAEGAIHQATETESSVSILADNIDILNLISKRELEGKESLEAAVEIGRASCRERVYI